MKRILLLLNKEKQLMSLWLKVHSNETNVDIRDNY